MFLCRDLETWPLHCQSDWRNNKKVLIKRVESSFCFPRRGRKPYARRAQCTATRSQLLFLPSTQSLTNQSVLPGPEREAMFSKFTFCPLPQFLRLLFIAHDVHPVRLLEKGNIICTAFDLIRMSGTRPKLIQCSCGNIN